MTAPETDLFAAIEAAAATLAPVAVRTPLLESPLLNEHIGGRLLIKAEVLQRTGSFKFRGAYNRMTHLNAAERKQGVVAFSSGNHAQGVAAAARMLGVSAVIVMPSDAPLTKIADTGAWGAEVVLYDRTRENRETIATAIADADGRVMIRPFDDPLVIAGQGTMGLELVEQAGAMGSDLDAVLVPCSGGGLCAGIATALAARSPHTAVFAVEPEGFDDTKRSLAKGEPVTVEGGRTICDALTVNRPGALTFDINARLLAGGLCVSDSAAARAMATAFAHFKLVVEPGGAVALAAALSQAIDVRGKTVAVICSGGNVDKQLYCDALRGRLDTTRFGEPSTPG
ncbi:MAG: threonine ammonia-lyase [Rhodoplanes sp.]